MKSTLRDLKKLNTILENVYNIHWAVIPIVIYGSRAGLEIIMGPTFMKKMNQGKFFKKKSFEINPGYSSKCYL